MTNIKRKYDALSEIQEKYLYKLYEEGEDPLSIVFSYLDIREVLTNISLTCKKFKYIVDTKTFFSAKYVTPEIWDLISKKSIASKIESVQWCDSKCPYAFITRNNNTSNVKRVYVKFPIICDKHSRPNPEFNDRHFPNLERMVICHDIYIERFKNLRVIDVFWNTMTSPDCWAVAIQQLQHLRHINLQLFETPLRCTQSEIVNTVFGIMDKKPGLTCHLVANHQILEEYCLKHIAICRAIHSLDCDYITEKIAQSMSLNPNLNKISISKVIPLKNMSYTQHLHLVKFSLCNCEKMAFYQLVQSLKQYGKKITKLVWSCMNAPPFDVDFIMFIVTQLSDVKFEYLSEDELLQILKGLSYVQEKNSNLQRIVVKKTQISSLVVPIRNVLKDVISRCVNLRTLIIKQEKPCNENIDDYLNYLKMGKVQTFQPWNLSCEEEEKIQQAIAQRKENVPLRRRSKRAKYFK